MEEDVRITYETIYDMLRNEKQRDDLQKLPSSFFIDTSEYLEEKKKILNNENQDLFTESELEKTRVQINNIRRMIKEILDRREKKLIILAMNLARTENAVYDHSVLMDTEKNYLFSISELFKRYRENVVKRAANGIMPKDIGSTIVPHTMGSSSTPLVKAEQGTSVPKPAESTAGNQLVRFIHSVPKFMGPGGNVFGPYESEDMANLPEKIVKVLVNKGRAELINHN